MSKSKQVSRIIHHGHPKKPLNVYPDFKWLRQRVHRLCSFGFGVGLIRRGPGTFGTLLALLLWIPIHNLIHNDLVLGVLLLAAVVWGIYICQKTSDELGVKDYKGIVWDELAAFWMVLFVINDAFESPLWLLLAFVLFRIFDIFKPWPISLIDRRLSGGLGIMLDDLVAALYSLFVFAVIVRIVRMML